MTSLGTDAALTHRPCLCLWICEQPLTLLNGNLCTRAWPWHPKECPFAVRVRPLGVCRPVHRPMEILLMTCHPNCIFEFQILDTAPGPWSQPVHRATLSFNIYFKFKMREKGGKASKLFGKCSASQLIDATKRQEIKAQRARHLFSVENYTRAKTFLSKVATFMPLLSRYLCICEMISEFPNLASAITAVILLSNTYVEWWMITLDAQAETDSSWSGSEFNRGQSKLCHMLNSKLKSVWKSRNSIDLLLRVRKDRKFLKFE